MRTSITLSQERILSKFSPANWGYVITNTEKAYTANVPTLGQFADSVGEDKLVHWIRMQILALYSASSNKDIGLADGINIFATSFAMQVKGYKFTELMLFFARYKAGRYDNSFASFDARRIGNAFFREFIPQRNQELDRINSQRNLKEIEERRFVPPAGYSSLTWYQEIKRRAANGDAEAMRYLNDRLND